MPIDAAPALHRDLEAAAPRCIGNDPIAFPLNFSDGLPLRLPRRTDDSAVVVGP